MNYTWDNNGDLTARGNDSFSWDYEDRMTSATVGGTTTTFAYRGDGLRHSRTTGGNTTVFTWDVNRGLPVVLDDGNQYVYGAGLESMVTGSGTYYYLADGLGSTMAMVDTSGAVQKSYTYDVYGKPTATGSLANEFDFAGQETDPTGLQYLRARYYDTQAGRFTSREPMESVPGWGGNPYGYSSANPARLVDPSGLRYCDVDSCDDNPVLPARGHPYCGPSGCVGTTNAPPSQTPQPAATTTQAPAACTLTPPIICASNSGNGDDLASLISVIYDKLTGEYRSIALSLLDALPLAEACVAASIGTGVGAVAAPSCIALDAYIGGIAFIVSADSIDQSGCSEGRKKIARVANTINLFAEVSTAAEVSMLAIQTIATSHC